MRSMAYNMEWLFRNVLYSEEVMDQWLKERRLLPRQKSCPICDSPMKFAKGHGLGEFRCYAEKMHRRRRPTVAVSKGTWFESSRLSAGKIIKLTYCFSRNMKYEDAMYECSEENRTVSSETVSDWYSYCREVCTVALDRLYMQQGGVIGGPDHVVMIDEMKLGKRKYNRGRVVEGNWLLGIIDVISEDFRVVVIPNNDRSFPNLLSLIRQNVSPQSTIVTDCWKGYEPLSTKTEFINHLTVNHSYNFIDPDTGVHTQKIESQWRTLRRTLNTGLHKDRLLDTSASSCGEGT